MQRKPWVQEARKELYATQQEWVNALNKLGWEIRQSTVGTWESSGFLPMSLDPKSAELVAQSLNISVGELFRRQGYAIGEALQGYEVSPSMVELLEEMNETDEETLQKIMPLVKEHFKMLRSHLKD